MPTDEISWHAIASEINTRCLSLCYGNNNSEGRFISDIENHFKVLEISAAKIIPNEG